MSPPHNSKLEKAKIDLGKAQQIMGKLLEYVIALYPLELESRFSFLKQLYDNLPSHIHSRPDIQKTIKAHLHEIYILFDENVKKPWPDKSVDIALYNTREKCHEIIRRFEHHHLSVSKGFSKQSAHLNALSPFP